MLVGGVSVFTGGCAHRNTQAGALDKSDIKKLMAMQNRQVQSKEEKNPAKLPPMTAPEYEVLGDQCLRQGDIDRAFLQYDKALQLDTNNVDSRYKIAMIFCQTSCPMKPSENSKN